MEGTQRDGFVHTSKKASYIVRKHKVKTNPPENSTLKKSSKANQQTMWLYAYLAHTPPTSILFFVIFSKSHIWLLTCKVHKLVEGQRIEIA